MSIKRKLELSQSKTVNSSELSPFIAEQEFTELLWENGQIVMHGQSNRSRKNSYTDNLSSHSSRFQERECRNAAIPKIVNFGATTDFMANEFLAAVPSGPMGLNVQESDVIPWINYPMEDSIQNDYCSEFFSEISGPNSNLFSAHNNQVSADRNNCFTHIVRDSHNVEHGHGPIPLAGRSEASRVRTNPLFRSPQEGQTSILNAKSRVSEFGISGRCFTSNDRNLQKQDVETLKPPHISTGIGLVNFSHFSRPVTTVRSNLHSVDKLRSHEKPSTDTTSSNPVESMVLNSSDGLKNLPMIQAQPRTILPKIDLRLSANHSQEVFSIDRSEGVCQEDTSRSEHVNNISNANTSPSNHVNCRELDKVPEAIVASSSVCSVNIAGVTSNDTKQTTKRRNQEGEESGYQSEDLEDESVSLKKHASGRKANAKRSRAAEVHNLSERRRRDRINEKMRSLQELIPNCNKVDKASMLDEAIEYLKTLQLQVQIMSMSTGLCMPQMMLPSGMQHLRPPPMAHFSPMGMNMRMGMGYGYSMGMMDMNGNPSRPPVPIPAMHGQQQLPFPSLPGAPSFHGMPGQTSLQMFGIPGQGFPMSNSRAPSSSGLYANVNQLPEMPTATTAPLLTADAAPSANSKDQEQLFMQLDANRSARNSPIQTSSQAAKESFDHSVLIQMSNQASEPVEVET